MNGQRADRGKNHGDPDAGQPLEAIEAIEATTENIITHAGTY